MFRFYTCIKDQRKTCRSRFKQPKRGHDRHTSHTTNNLFSTPYNHACFLSKSLDKFRFIFEWESSNKRAWSRFKQPKELYFDTYVYSVHAVLISSFHISSLTYSYMPIHRLLKLQVIRIYLSMSKWNKDEGKGTFGLTQGRNNSQRPKTEFEPNKPSSNQGLTHDQTFLSP